MITRLLVGRRAGAPSHDESRRSLFAEPWLHLIAAGVGGYLGLRLGAVYDDTSVTLRKQAAGYKSLPSWAYSQLSPEELGECRAVSLTLTCASSRSHTAQIPVHCSVSPCVCSSFDYIAAAEMKEQRLAELQQKVVELAELEEKEYLEAQRAKQ